MPSLHTTSLPLPGLVRVERRVHGDHRGAFGRLFCADELADAGWIWPVAQVNHSQTRGAGTVRGLHYQTAPYAEAKLVSCIAGAVWDVAVDLRPESPTYLRWHAEVLRADDGAALLIPPGCAHGFQVLGREAQLVYCHSAAHAPGHEAGLHAEDPALAIAWPLPVCGLSSRDAAFAPLHRDLAGRPS